MSKSVLLGLSGLAAVAALLIAGSAGAADPVRYTAEKKLRLHIDTDLLSWTQRRDWYEPDARPSPDPHDRTNAIGFGVARPLMIDRTGGDVLFTGTSQFALGVGYGVHRHVLIGARLGFAFDRVRDRNDIDDMSNPDSFQVQRFFGASFTPYIEILPIPEGRILPYILFRGGFAGAAAGIRSRTEAGPIVVDTLSRTSVIAPTIGVGAGAHFFVIPQFSLDLGLNFDYRWILARQVGKDLENGSTTKTDWERNSQAFQLGLNLGLSVWFL